MENQNFQDAYSILNEVIEVLNTKDETLAIEETQQAIQELERLREIQKAKSKIALEDLKKKLAEAEANANHTLQELNEFRESGVLSNLEKENHQLEQENHQLEQEIKQLQNEYSELLIEEKTLELKEKKEDKPEINPTLLKIGIYRELGIEAVTDNDGNVTKCHIHNSNTNNNHTIFFPNNQNSIQQTQPSIAYATTNLLWNLCTSKDDNELINIDLTRGINNNIGI